MHRYDLDVAVDARAQLGEGAVWDDETGRLIWLDMPAGVIHTYRPADGATSQHSIPPPVSTICLRRSGGLLITHGRRLGLFSLDDDTVVDGPEHIGLSHILNDGSIDAAGRLWVGTALRRTLKPPAHDLADDVPDEGGFFVIGPDLRLNRVLSGVTTCNGIDWSPDGATMYAVIDGTIRIFAFDLDKGSIAPRGVVPIPAEHGEPDGMILDAEGMIWAAFYGNAAVRRYSPEGRLLADIPIPVPMVTSCAFGGDDLETLFVTTAAWHLSDEDRRLRFPHAGALFALRPGVAGRRQHRFEG